MSLSSDAIIERYDSAAKYSSSKPARGVGRAAAWHGPGRRGPVAVGMPAEDGRRTSRIV